MVKSIDLSKDVSAAALLKAFRTHFLPDVDHVARNFDQFNTNFDYTYRRRNVRLTFVIALIVALVGGLSLERLWLNASRMDPASATAYAEQVLALSKEIGQDSVHADSLTAAQLNLLRQAAQRLVPDSTTVNVASSVYYFMEPRQFEAVWSGGFLSVVRYLLGCMLTALLVTFGAPFWNDIASALLRLQRGLSATAQSAAKEASNG